MKLRPLQPGAVPARRSTARRFLLALAGALVAHALIALTLLHVASSSNAPAKAAAPVSVELRVAAAHPKPAPIPPPVAPPPPSHRRPNQHDAHAEQQPAHDAAASESASSASPTSEPAHDEQWAKAEGLASSGPPPARLGVSRTLADPLASLGALPESKRAGAGTWTNGFGEGPQGPVKQLTREEALAAEKSRVEGEVKGWVIDEVAFARARDGRDAYWQGVQDSLTKGFAPGWTLLDNRPASTSGLPRGMRQMAEIYKRAASNYGKSGSPISPDAKVRGMPGESSNENMLSGLAADRGMRGTAMDSALANIQQAQAAGGSADNPWSTKLIVHVLLTQTSDGALEDVSIAASSGNADYDKLVLGQARSLSAKGLLGAPPKDRRRTLWAFEADFEQAPPMPVAGCQLDVNFVPTNCFYPMKKSVHSRVTLEAVY